MASADTQPLIASGLMRAPAVRCLSSGRKVRPSSAALADQDNRLVVISYDEEAKEDMAEVSHEALIREWKKLHDWVAEDPQFLQWNDAVERRCRRYEKSGRKDDDLLMGSELDEALKRLRTRGASVTAMAVAGTAGKASANQTISQAATRLTGLAAAIGGMRPANANWPASLRIAALSTKQTNRTEARPAAACAVGVAA